MSHSPKPWEVSTLHSIAVRLETLRQDYLSLSGELREILDDAFDPENQFLNLINRLETTAGDLASIAEEY